MRVSAPVPVASNEKCCVSQLQVQLAKSEMGVAGVAMVGVIHEDGSSLKTSHARQGSGLIRGFP